MKIIIAVVCGILALVIFVSVIGSRSEPAVTSDQQPVSQKQADDLPATPHCTSFEYSRWSLCGSEGAQSRVVTEAYPKGCRVGNGVEQSRQCTYVPISANAQQLLTMMANQIRHAQGGGVQASFLSGEAGGAKTNINWTISDDGNLLIQSLVTDRQTDRAISHLLLRDTDRDFRPDIYSQDGSTWHEITSLDHQTQAALSVTWGIYLAYFGSYLLAY
ncbi:MAG: hypothetical protein Q7S50_00080 [bacterium]|nr:hypothetical protein [bacterium]